MSASKDRSRIIERLAASPFSVRIEPGLSDLEFSEIEDRYELSFPPDLRALLAVGLPVEEPSEFSALRGFPDWRNADVTILRERLTWPVEGVLEHVRESGFWDATWPVRPASAESALDMARLEMTKAPVLVPIYSHRYIPSTPSTSGNPVFSAMATDVICYGADLDDYFENEFFDKSNEFHRSGGIVTKPIRHIPFWGDLAGF